MKYPLYINGTYYESEFQYRAWEMCGYVYFESEGTFCKHNEMKECNEDNCPFEIALERVSK